MRTDPSDTGGLFVSRRPGTAPVHYRALPQRAGELRQRVDSSLAGVMLSGMFAITCAIGVILFGVWFLVIHGPGSNVFSGSGRV